MRSGAGVGVRRRPGSRRRRAGAATVAVASWWWALPTTGGVRPSPSRHPVRSVDCNGVLPLVSGPVPDGFERRTIVVPTGPGRPYDEREWRDALVVVALGALEVECWSGTRRRLGRGALLWFDGLPLRALHSCGEGPAVLVATARARPAR